MRTRTLVMPSLEQYAAAFTTERARTYPEVDYLEHFNGFALDRARLEAAARILACPVKASPPNWQHGRILYAVARKYLETQAGPVLWFDCGTAKGFSALIGVWALADAGVEGRVESVDVIDPYGKAFRNSVLDVTDENRLADYLRAWPESKAIRFHQATGIFWLEASNERVHLAFIDGKHTAPVVAAEGRILATRQQRGDVVVFDDVQIPGVREAVAGLAGRYELETVTLATADRAYAIGVRR